jgi:SAM-dependent methyltransferase
MSWYSQWFTDEMYLELYAHRDAAEARQAIDLFEQASGLRGGDAPATTRHPLSAEETPWMNTAPLLDLACGTGRHAFELARRGYAVIAADLSPTLLAAAARKTRRYHRRISLLRADMRRLPFSPAFSAVLQLFTAFGYFQRDEENEAVIAGVRHCLPAGGWYMLDFLNAESVADSLIPFTKTALPGGHVIQERSIHDNRVVKHIRIHENGREREFVESVRLFDIDDFAGMFSRNGFKLMEVYGDYDGTAFAAASPRCIMFAVAQ